MPLKKNTFSPAEIAIYDEAVIYKRGNYWQFRMWLAGEGKYARFSLGTSHQNTAISKAQDHVHLLKVQQKQGKTYFSKTTKQGVEQYLANRSEDVEDGIIVKGRYGTIKTHLDHWLNYIGRSAKLKELERNACEDYFHHRTKTKKNIAISRTTVLNEQSTINAMMSWLYKNKETDIEAFDFKKLKPIDRGDDSLRRASFDDHEIKDIQKCLIIYIAKARKNIDDAANLIQVIVGYYLLISIISGLRRGEQLQLRWQDIRFLPHKVIGKTGASHDLVEITVRAETTKVRTSRKFVIKDDLENFDDLLNLLQPRFTKANKGSGAKFADALIFSADGKRPITARAIAYHFERIVALAGIKNVSTRNLVPYSFRHYFITQKINSGLAPMAVAEMCGTSAAQIEKTYYHTTREKMISNALADYYIKDGLLIPK
jgi:integrase